MSFQIEILPYKNESFISWFTRTAFENGTDPKSFALSIWRQDSILYRDLDRYTSKDLLNEVLKYSSLSYQELKNLTLEFLIDKVDTSPTNNVYKKWYFITPFGQKGKIRTNGIHFCSECLKSKIPNINKYWRFSFYIGCPIHKKILLLKCQKCNQVFSPEKLNYLQPHIYICSKCGFDLRNSSTNKVKKEVLDFQKSLFNSLINCKISSSFPLITNNDVKDLFLTLNIFLAFIYKIIRQPIRYKGLIIDFDISTKYSFKNINNGTFSRLNITDREELLYLVSKIFKFSIDEIIKILSKNNISKNIFRQTFETISPTIDHILERLNNNENNHKSRKIIKKEKKPKNKEEVDKLFKDILPYIFGY
ncbi:TniQ family protein [Aliarcobacter butzleri]|uniref:TniQ family protein n=1 Tax=Aliarcobacter butzleri TaxID=28197 RepID=UPI00263DBBF8|nr:TniQ family protein [Aliarcobacter butzleri]MDN5079581.1 TniQ family protein [Aliarcobacter butzleri]